MYIEKDTVKILSGVRKGITTGSPVSLLIYNKDWENWVKKLEEEEDILNPRPGHADLPGFLKYRLSSVRDVIERSSARETAVRVAVGAIAKLLLRKLDIHIISFVEQIGREAVDYGKFSLDIDKDFDPYQNKRDAKLVEAIESSPVRCPDAEASGRMTEAIKRVAAEGDTLGGAFRVLASGLVPGIGSFSEWSLRLDGRISGAVFSIPSIKAVSFGNGLMASVLTGTEFHDEIFFDKEKKSFYRKTNNAGGLEGGMTNGELLDVRATAKPIPTTLKGLASVNIRTKSGTRSLKERSDFCAVPSASVVAEAMVAIVLAQSYLEKFGSDSIGEIIENHENYKKYLRNI